MEEQRPLPDLQLDFKCHVAKNHGLKTCVPHPQHQGLSLPIDDRASVKKRLREEMNKEYNQFLQKQAQIRKLNRRVLPVTSKPEKIQPSKIVNSTGEDHLFLLKTNANTDKEHAASRRDAAALTEDAGERSTGSPGPQSRRRWNILNTKGPQSSEEGQNTEKEDSLGCQTQQMWIAEPESSELELDTDKEDQIDFRARRRQSRNTNVCVYRANSANLKAMEASAICCENSSDQTGQTEKQTPDNTKRHTETTVVSSNVKKEFATGLIIGKTEEPTVITMKKEQYKQELLRQIAEKRDSKLKEKKMELQVAATGATGPEKEPDRIKRFGAELEQTDSFRQDAPHNPRADMDYVEEVFNPKPKGDKPFEDSRRSPSSEKTLSSKLRHLQKRTVPLSVAAVPHALPPLDYFSEDHNRAFMHQLLGEGGILRFAGVPPLAPIVPNTYMTPYDGAHAYHGNGNYPLHLNSVKNQTELPSNVEVQNNMNNDMSPKKLPPLNANGCIDSPPSSTEGLHVDKSLHRRDNAVNYQEALRQQIKEKESHKRREKEENERSDVKLHAEMNAFSPWGRSGGGAPNKDQNGNLISDFYQMHRINEEKKSTPGAYETGAQLPGSDNQSSQRQLSTKERLREEQKREIEERKRKQVEERERMRIVEEKEEERLAKERAFIKQNYEEEQRKLKNKGKIQPIPQIPQKDEVTSARQGKQRRLLSKEERGGHTSPVISERGPSPPIPTLQKIRTKNPVNSRLSSVTPNTKHPVSAAAHNQLVPERTSLPHNGQEEVIRELSAIRRLLRTEQKKLEVQMGQTFVQEDHHSIPSRGNPTMDACESARKAPHSALRTPSSSAVAPVNKKNHKGLKPAELQTTD